MISISFYFKFIRDYLLGLFRPLPKTKYSKVKIIDYFKKLSPARYDTEHIASKDDPFIRSLKQSELLLSKITPESTVLDLGCGLSEILYTLPALRDTKYIGLDISLNFLSLARSYHFRPNCKWIQGDADTLPLKSHCVDVVLAINLIPYIKDFSGLLECLKRLIKPDGIIVLVNATPHPVWEEEFSGIRVILRTPEEIIASVERANLRVIDQKLISFKLLSWLPKANIHYGITHILSFN